MQNIQQHAIVANHVAICTIAVKTIQQLFNPCVLRESDGSLGNQMEALGITIENPILITVPRATTAVLFIELFQLTDKNDNFVNIKDNTTLHYYCKRHTFSLIGFLAYSRNERRYIRSISWLSTNSSLAPPFGSTVIIIKDKRCP